MAANRVDQAGAGGPRSQAPTSAADMPIEVRRLLKSYALKDLRWSEPMDRHAIVTAILTRGNADAERWLWTHCSVEEVRSLLRAFGGAGWGEEDRQILREKMGLTEHDIPRRPFAAMPWRG